MQWILDTEVLAVVVWRRFFHNTTSDDESINNKQLMGTGYIIGPEQYFGEFLTISRIDFDRILDPGDPGMHVTHLLAH